MDAERVRTGLLLPLFLVGSLVLSGGDARAQGTCVSAACHATLLKGGTVHPPTESCDACHESTAAPHPQKGKKTFKLTQNPPDLCLTCHEAFGKKSQVHRPVKDGQCLSCHNPHASAEPRLLVRPLGDLCRSCHADHAKYKYTHGPVSAGECTACHAPHESDAAHLLKKPSGDLCFDCHGDMQDVLKKKDVHPALTDGCTTCHNPHGSEHPKFLAEEGPKLCFQCHDEMAGKIEKSPVVHAAVRSEKGCVTCHSPHASDAPKLLLLPGKETCLACHSSVITKTMTSVHGPIRDGLCTPCHDPHASQYPRLLVKEFPPDAYVPYTDTEFALCFGCHNRDLLRYPDTSYATNFRDGERNLHYLHVNNAQKGRSCRLCHSIHGSSSPKLIAGSVPFGKWSLPVKFVKTATGGSCAPGCHRPQAYDRQTPGKKPEAPKPAAKTQG